MQLLQKMISSGNNESQPKMTGCVWLVGEVFVYEKKSWDDWCFTPKVPDRFGVQKLGSQLTIKTFGPVSLHTPEISSWQPISMIKN